MHTANLFLLTAFSVLLFCTGCGDEFGILLKNYNDLPSSLIQVSPGPYTFSSTRAGQQSSDVEFTITNNGTTAVEIISTGMTDSANFSLTSSPAGSIAPGANTSFTARFNPQTAGEKESTITITHTAAGSPTSIQISGLCIPGEIYWTGSDRTINCVNKDGSGNQVLINVPGTPLDIEIYSAGEEIYWTEYTDSKFQIKRSDTYGTNVEIYTAYPDTAFHGPTTIAIDNTTGLLYWSMHNTSSLNNTIFYTGLNAFAQNTWREITQSYYTYGLCLDTIHRMLYFTDNTYWDVSTPAGSGYNGISAYGTLDDNGAAFSSPLSINNPPGPSSALRDIAADSASSRIFYVTNDSSGMRIMRARYDFQEITELISSQAAGIQKIALDLAERKIYWTTATGNDIYRADLDSVNSNIEKFLTLSSRPNGIVVVP